jgi:hypothetical protein
LFGLKSCCHFNLTGEFRQSDTKHAHRYPLGQRVRWVVRSPFPAQGAGGGRGGQDSNSSARQAPSWITVQTRTTRWRCVAH